MTPFEKWWQSKFDGDPSDPIYAPVATKIKADFAACWNAALDAGVKEMGQGLVLPDNVTRRLLEDRVLRARVTP
jgi:hypothetical protein